MSKTRSIVYGNLASLIDGGLPLSRCLDVAGSNIRGKFAKSIREMGSGVHRGGSLTDMMKKHPMIFPELDRLAIEAGELSGTLVECMKELSGWYSFVYKTRHVVIAGLVLPFLLFHMMVFIESAPDLFLDEITFEEYAVLVFGGILKLYAVTAVFALIIKFWSRLEPFLSQIPFCWWMIKRVAAYRYCQVFYLLFIGGVPIARCAETAADMSCSTRFKKLIEGGTENAKRGMPVYEGFSPRLDREFVDSWSVGEESGELDRMLQSMIDKYRFGLERMFDAIGFWIPKVVYVIVSILIIKAIYKMMGRII